jgi:hypothetical protein
MTDVEANPCNAVANWPTLFDVPRSGEPDPRMPSAPPSDQYRRREPGLHGRALAPNHRGGACVQDQGSAIARSRRPSGPRALPLRSPRRQLRSFACRVLAPFPNSALYDC